MEADEVTLIGVKHHLAGLHSLEAESPVIRHDRHGVLTKAAGRDEDNFRPRMRNGTEAIRLHFLDIGENLAGQSSDLERLHRLAVVADSDDPPPDHERNAPQNATKTHSAYLL